ncbi:MAG: hypothetical protein ACTIJ9_14260 [Aequorivita sp.]
MENNKDAEIEAQKIEGEKMMAAGYMPGRIVFSDLVDDCEYTIQLKEEGQKDFYYVDPINLDEAFMKNERTVWVKYNNLRRMNRCEKARPVEILEIKDRLE